jgi:hypothetical protein
VADSHLKADVDAETSPPNSNRIWVILLQVVTSEMDQIKVVVVVWLLLFKAKVAQWVNFRTRHTKLLAAPR